MELNNKKKEEERKINNKNIKQFNVLEIFCIHFEHFV